MFKLLRFTLSTELLRCDFYCDPSLLKEQKGYRISDWEIGSCLLKFEVVTSSQKYRVIVETTKVLTRFLSYINENIFQRGLGNHKKTIVTFFLFSIWLSAASAHMLKDTSATKWCTVTDTHYCPGYMVVYYSNQYSDYQCSGQIFSVLLFLLLLLLGGVF